MQGESRHPEGWEEGADEAVDAVLPIRLADLDDHEARYVNLLNVNYDRASFQVIFSQFLQPVVTSSDDARRLAGQGFVPAKPIARLLLTPLMMEETIALFELQLRRFREEHEMGLPPTPEPGAPGE